MPKNDTSASRELSVQQRADEKLNSLKGGVDWVFNVNFNRQIGDNDIVMPPWWSEEREQALQVFTMLQGNDILQGALSSFVKKFKSIGWGIEGPIRAAKGCQEMMSEANFGEGLSSLIGKTVHTFSWSDKGAFWEVLGPGRPDELLVEKPLGVAYLDNQYCTLTGSLDHPVIYYNPKNGSFTPLHASRVIHFVDTPSPNERMNNTGFCAISRIISSSEIILKLNKYKKERLDDLPEAGLLMFNNVLPERWDNKLAENSAQRKQVGNRYWKPIMTFFGLDPSQPAKADFTSFSKLPEHFDEFQSTETYLNIVALSFGVDVREFWPKPIGGLGTGTEVNVQADKAINKGVGDILQMITKALNWKVMPKACEFSFDFVDDSQDLKQAQINNTKIEAIMKMWVPDAMGISPVKEDEIRQMLADNVTYFHEAFLQNNLVDLELLTDVDPISLDVGLGPQGFVNSKGQVYAHKPAREQVLELEAVNE